MKTEIAQTLESYPADIRNRLVDLRHLVLNVANEEGVTDLEECLKWGQISYICKSGSTIRIGSIGSDQKHYALFCHCQTRLIDTFREVFSGQLSFDGNRAIVFSVDQKIQVNIVKSCIAIGLKYHRVKHLPLLGA